MHKNPYSQSGLFTPRMLLAFALCSVGVLPTILSVAGTPPSGVDRPARPLSIVNLTGVTNAQYLTVTLSNLRDELGDISASISQSLAVLVGDVTANGTVSNTDVAAVKTQVGAPVTSSNFRNDVNTNGVLSNADVAATKARVGALP
jgi:hypothetical protein